jgi:hypothetical protein
MAGLSPFQALRKEAYELGPLAKTSKIIWNWETRQYE